MTIGTIEEKAARLHERMAVYRLRPQQRRPPSWKAQSQAAGGDGSAVQFTHGDVRAEIADMGLLSYWFVEVAGEQVKNGGNVSHGFEGCVLEALERMLDLLDERAEAAQVALEAMGGSR